MAALAGEQLRQRIRYDLLSACENGNIGQLQLGLEQVPTENAARILDFIFHNNQQQQQQEGQGQEQQRINQEGPMEESFTLLTVSASRGFLPCLELLLDRGATVDFSDDNGNTPLHHACVHHQHEVIRTLIQRNANAMLVNNIGLSAIEVATATNDPITLNSLIESLNHHHHQQQQLLLLQQQQQQQWENMNHEEQRTRHLSTLLRPLARRRTEDNMSLLYRPPREDITSYILK